MTHEQIVAELARLQAENAELKNKQAVGGMMKVSEKGAISVYGFGQWPVTLYISQWEALFKRVPEIKDFIAANLTNPRLKLEKTPKA